MNIPTGHSRDGALPTQFWLQKRDRDLRLYQMEILAPLDHVAVTLNCYFNKQLISSCEIDELTSIESLLEHFDGFVQELDDEYRGHSDWMNDLCEHADGDMAFCEFFALFVENGIPAWAAALFAADVRPTPFDEMCRIATSRGLAGEMKLEGK